jgi:hypothetical protein
VVGVVHGPAAELTRGGVDGLVVAGADPARLVPPVLDLLGSGTDLAGMGAAARERWERDHSPQARATRLIDIYDALSS